MNSITRARWMRRIGKASPGSYGIASCSGIRRRMRSAKMAISTSKRVENDKRIPLSSFGKEWPDQFHTGRMDWNADSIKLYLDDVLVNSQDLSKTINAQPLSGAAVENPFHTPMYILLNQAIGGTRGGDPS